MDISIIIPVLNEQDNVLPLYTEIGQALSSASFRYEVIFVDDGSTDATAERLEALLPSHPEVRLIRHRRRSGKSTALRTGVYGAAGVIVVTLDGDGQDDPADIPRFIGVIQVDDGPALVAGVRSERRDKLSRRVVSRFGNSIRRALLGDQCPDSACGFKAFQREAFLALPYFAAMHRFLPALFGIHGQRIACIPVHHRPRSSGHSKYGMLDRGLAGLVDLLGVLWLKHRSPLADSFEQKWPPR